MGVYIKENLKTLHIKQAELADRLGISLQVTKNILRRENITISTLDRIASALNVEPWTLLVDPVRVPYIYKAMETDAETLARENEQLKERLAQMESKLKELFRDL